MGLFFVSLTVPKRPGPLNPHFKVSITLKYHHRPPLVSSHTLVKCPDNQYLACYLEGIQIRKDLNIYWQT